MIDLIPDSSSGTRIRVIPKIEDPVMVRYSINLNKYNNRSILVGPLGSAAMHRSLADGGWCVMSLLGRQ